MPALKKCSNVSSQSSGFLRKSRKGANLAWSKDGTLPSEFQLVKAGENEFWGDDVKWVYDQTEARPKQFESRDRIPINIAHLYLESDNPATHEAVGWFTLDYRKDGAWATDIEWNASLQDRYKNGDKPFKGFSIEFPSSEDGLIKAITGLALTNWPAAKDQLPLVASRDAKEKKDMEDTSTDEKDLVTKTDETSTEDEKKALPEGISVDTPPAELIATIEALLEKIDELNAQVASKEEKPEDEEEETKEEDDEEVKKSLIVDALVKDAFITPARAEELKQKSLVQLKASDKILRHFGKPIVTKTKTSTVTVKSIEEKTVNYDSPVFKQLGIRPKAK